MKTLQAWIFLNEVRFENIRSESRKIDLNNISCWSLHIKLENLILMLHICHQIMSINRVYLLGKSTIFYNIQKVSN